MKQTDKRRYLRIREWIKAHSATYIRSRLGITKSRAEGIKSGDKDQIEKSSELLNFAIDAEPVIIRDELMAIEASSGLNRAQTALMLGMTIARYQKAVAGQPVEAIIARYVRHVAHGEGLVAAMATEIQSTNELQEETQMNAPITFKTDINLPDFTWNKEKPCAVISGMSGCGKTYLATRMAKQAYAQGGFRDVYYVCPPATITPEDLADAHGNMGIQVVEIENDFSMLDILIGLGSDALVIIDEAWQYKLVAPRLPSYVKHLKPLNSRLIVVAQSMTDAVFSWAGGPAVEKDHVGHIILGAQAVNERVASQEWAFLQEPITAARQLNQGEFIIVTAPE